MNTRNPLPSSALFQGPPMKTSLLLRTVLASVLLAASTTAVAAEGPNIVIIFADDKY